MELAFIKENATEIEFVRTDSAEISCSDGTSVDGSCSDVSLSSSVSSPGSWSVASPFNSFSVYDSP
jgi:hypothetical protein